MGGERERARESERECLSSFSFCFVKLSKRKGVEEAKEMKGREEDLKERFWVA